MQAVHRTVRLLRTDFSSRPFATFRAVSSSWSPSPSPPRLPKEEQELFEKLQQQSTGAFSTPQQLNREKTSQPSEDATQASAVGSEADKMLEMLRERAQVNAQGEGEELHPNVRRGAAPEFEGDRNPKTGEVGGPKNEPLRWGVSGDWSYNGRVTDF